MTDSPPKRKGTPELVAAVVDHMRHLFSPGQVTELRAIEYRPDYGAPHTRAGFYDVAHLPEMVKAAIELSDRSKGVYFMMNPLRPEILARRCNRVDRAGEAELAKDADVIARRWLLIDADPVRDPYVSSSDAEKAAAHETILAVRVHLAGRGWPVPILADSGNGYHLLYRVDLPADDGGMVRRVLQALASRFDSDRVKIDQKVFNAARICKFYGTVSRKGDSTPDRPHRRAKLLEVVGE